MGRETVASKAEAARRVVANTRAQQRTAARRNAAIAALSALALVAVFAALVAFIVRSDPDSGPYAVYDSGALRAPTGADDSGGILIGPAGVAGGAPALDAVRVDLYEDPICPGCAAFVHYASREILGLVDSGEVALYFHPISFMDEASAGTHYSTRAVGAWATVAEYDPEPFWDFVEALYAAQPPEGGPGLTNSEIAEAARQAGVSEEAIARIADGEFTRWVSVATNQAARDVGLRTPTLLVGGVHFESGPHSRTDQVVPGWGTPGEITRAVAFVMRHGAEAFGDYLVAPDAEPRDVDQ